MVVYQMLLQLAINMVFHYDGASMTNAQASLHCLIHTGVASCGKVLIRYAHGSQLVLS